MDLIGDGGAVLASYAMGLLLQEQMSISIRGSRKAVSQKVGVMAKT